jgi:hypothetical protein
VLLRVGKNFYWLKLFSRSFLLKRHIPIFLWKNCFLIDTNCCFDRLSTLCQNVVVIKQPPILSSYSFNILQITHFYLKNVVYFNLIFRMKGHKRETVLIFSFFFLIWNMKSVSTRETWFWCFNRWPNCAKNNCADFPKL